MQNFVYLVGDEKAKKAVVVDPAWEVDTIFKAAEKDGLELVGALVSHAHFDHTNGIPALLKRQDMPVYAHKREAEFARAGSPLLGDLGQHVKGVEGGDKLKVGDVEIEFVHTPGHTPGSQCFRVRDCLLSGDTLFVGGCGRSDLPGGDAGELYKSLKSLSKMPPSMVLYPGHDYGSVPSRALSEEAAENPYLNLESLEQFIQRVG
jgi:glyoxylase-like metal-dependent hydrolase (beta-lactamase superfamily II)